MLHSRACQSKRASAGTTHHRRWETSRNTSVLATVSARALIGILHEILDDLLIHVVFVENSLIIFEYFQL